MTPYKIFDNELRATFKNRSLVFLLGWQDIKQRYRRSKLGPFWLTISMGVMIGMIGLVFGQVFKAPMHEYLPFLASGIIIWTFFSTSITEGSASFIDAAGMIRQLNLPLLIYPARVLWRNLVIMGHNVLILPLVFLCVGKEITWNVIWVIPGLLLMLFNLLWMSVFLGTICCRFRDMPQIVSSLLQVFLYVTPVIWMPNSLSQRSASLLIDPNPIYHLMQLVRAPLLGQPASLLNWGVSIFVCLVGFVFSGWFFGKFKRRIAYWL